MNDSFSIRKSKGEIKRRFQAGVMIGTCRRRDAPQRPQLGNALNSGAFLASAATRVVPKRM